MQLSTCGKKQDYYRDDKMCVQLKKKTAHAYNSLKDKSFETVMY